MPRILAAHGDRIVPTPQTGTCVRPAGVAGLYGRPNSRADILRTDQVLLFSGSGLILTTAVLTANATAGSNRVIFTFHPTSGATPGPAGINTASYDPLNISTHAFHDHGSKPPWGTKNSVTLGSQFCGSDWILKLAPITYSVDSTTDPNNPTLIRTVKGSSPNVVMDQIVGFKVGASIWNNATNSTNVQYYYDSSQYPVPNDFSAVRSVRVSLSAAPSQP